MYSILNKHQISPNTVCDVGCGAGGILVELQKKMSASLEFKGYDISPQAISICKTRENQNLKFYNVDFISIDSDTFDVLLLLDVFEHIPDYLGFLNALQGRARWFIFHIPLDISVHTVIRNSHIKFMRHNYGHLHYFTKETALATLEDTGFTVIDFFYTIDDYSIDEPPTSLKSALKQLLWIIWLGSRRVAFWLNQDIAARFFKGLNLLVFAKGKALEVETNNMTLGIPQ